MEVGWCVQGSGTKRYTSSVSSSWLNVDPLCLPAARLWGCLFMYGSASPLRVPAQTQVSGRLLKLTTPKDIQALKVKAVIYDFML